MIAFMGVVAVCVIRKKDSCVEHRTGIIREIKKKQSTKKKRPVKSAFF